MGTKICMNEGCRGTTSPEWKKGWGLKSGGFANLCYGCGSAYENLIFCETFHREESGWRECKLCGKHIHCGCIASRYLHEYLDFGGIGCISCTKTLDSRSIRRTQIPSNEVPNGFSTFGKIGVPQSSLFETRSGVNNVDNGNLTHSGKPVEPNDSNHFPQMPKVDMDPSVGKIKREETMVPMRELGSCFPNLAHQSVGSSGYFKPDNNNNRPALGLKDMYESLAQPSLSFSLSTPNAVLPFTSGVAEGKEPIPFQQGQRTRHILPKPPKTGLGMDSETSKGMGSQARIARPPAEGRGRNQLLPRYWPRITDQELQQLSGDLNSTIVPLFEKVLSASDAGRIGRLVLPKACAEAYFPPINYSEGLPIKIQDVKGKEWTFQFRFWPNNNSRMYVLEGVTPCIQNMQLQAGDTVIFSRIDPGGRLVMGFRKAKTLLDNIQDSQTSALPGESSFSGFNENLPTEKTNEDVSEQGMMQEKKKARNIGSKSKRLHIHSEDAYELRVTWEEAQELLRPPPSVNPTIVMVEDYEFEEYDEPPVFGKRTLFTAREYGEQEQWAHCDGCFKWRKLPLDVLLPPKWTCSDNIWDPNRCSCSAPEETSARELERCLRTGKEFKKRRITENKLTQEPEPSGLDALATAAVLGDNVAEADENIAGATTKHPRHRPGCTCIVCIQPPSGKGKHKPTCICNVCMTVKRRFKTLMLRKKKRQSEREAEMARGTPKDDAPPEKELEVAETVKGQQLDLNSHPSIAEETGVVSVMSLVQTSSFRFESYLKQKGLMVLDPSRAAGGGGGGERVEPPPESEKGGQESVVQEEENRGETG